jgi:NEDD4-binding protein 2
MRGVSGSGKSTIAKKLAEVSGAEIYSTDDFFMKDGKYVFDINDLGKNHEMNRQRTETAMQENKSVIVDNTNLTKRDMKPYVDLARKYNYDVEFIQVEVPDMGTLKERQAKRKDINKELSEELITYMINKYEKDITIDDFDDVVKTA